jgi:hypothetical protein
MTLAQENTEKIKLIHHFLENSAAHFPNKVALIHEDIQMVVLPFFYVFGKSLLNTHFAVGGSVVINNKKDDFGGNKLFALVTPKDNKFSAMTLMCILEKKLPRYKMPSEVIPIRAIPKKANGKIDRTKCLELLAN